MTKITKGEEMIEEEKRNDYKAWLKAMKNIITEIQRKVSTISRGW